AGGGWCCWCGLAATCCLFDIGAANASACGFAGELVDIDAKVFGNVAGHWGDAHWCVLGCGCGADVALDDASGAATTLDVAVVDAKLLGDAACAWANGWAFVLALVVGAWCWVAGCCGAWCAAAGGGRCGAARACHLGSWR